MKFNKTTRIVENIINSIPSMFNHYLEQKINNSNEKCNIDFSIFEIFSDLSIFIPPESTKGKEAAKNSQNLINIFKEHLQDYLKIKKYIEGKLDINDEFLTNLTGVKIYTLSLLQNKIFSNREVAILLSQYDKWKGGNEEDKKVLLSVQERFKKLFLKIDKESAEAVKQEFLKNHEFKLLGYLLIKFEFLRLSNDIIAKLLEKDISFLIYFADRFDYLSIEPKVFSDFIKDKKDIRFIESTGANLCSVFKIVNLDVAKKFVNITNSFNLASNSLSLNLHRMFNEFIFPCLDCLEVNEVNENFDRVVFLEMLKFYIKKAHDNKVNIIFENNHMLIIFKLINHLASNLRIKPFLSCVKAIIVIVKAMNFKLIETDRELLVTSSIDQFEFKFNLSNKSKIVALISDLCGDKNVKERIGDFNENCNLMEESIETTKLTPLDTAWAYCSLLIMFKKFNNYDPDIFYEGNRIEKYIPKILKFSGHTVDKQVSFRNTKFFKKESQEPIPKEWDKLNTAKNKRKR